MTDDMREHFPFGVLPEQARIDLYPAETVAAGGKARDLTIGEPGADGETVQAFAFFEQLLEAAPVFGRDLDHGRKVVDQRVEIFDPARRDLERVSRVIVSEHHAVTVDDNAAIGGDRHD